MTARVFLGFKPSLLCRARIIFGPFMYDMPDATLRNEGVIGDCPH